MVRETLRGRQGGGRNVHGASFWKEGVCRIVHVTEILKLTGGVGGSCKVMGAGRAAAGTKRESKGKE